MKILDGRWGGIAVELAHVQVQGAPAPDQIVAAFGYFNQLASPVDVVVLIRGGGSLEDLQAFNTEPVARAVAGSRTPTIVGVGHEVDTSLADYAADRRAATPTDAARIAVPDRTEVLAEIIGYERRLTAGLGRSLAERNARIDRHLVRIEQFVRRPLEQVTASQHRLQQAGVRLSGAASRHGEGVARLQERISSQSQQLLAQRTRQVASLERLIANGSPQATLERGYSIVRHNGEVLRDAGGVRRGDSVMIQLAKGQLTTEVTGE